MTSTIEPAGSVEKAKNDADTEVTKEKSGSKNGNGNGNIQASETKIDLAELKSKKINELVAIAKEMGLERVSGLKKQDLIFEILKTQTEARGLSGVRAAEIVIRCVARVLPRAIREIV